MSCWTPAEGTLCTTVPRGTDREPVAPGRASRRLGARAWSGAGRPPGDRIRHRVGCGADRDGDGAMTSCCWRGNARRERAPAAGAPRQKPGTPSLLRELNDRAALELLLTEGPLTRAQISERTGVSKVTVSQMLARLEERGLVMIAGEQAGGRGPNAALYSVVRSSAYVAGLYVDFDLVSAAVADVTGQRVAVRQRGPERRRRPGADGPRRDRAGLRRAPGSTSPRFPPSSSAAPASSTRRPASPGSRRTCPPGTRACPTRCARCCTPRW